MRGRRLQIEMDFGLASKIFIFRLSADFLARIRYLLRQAHLRDHFPRTASRSLCARPILSSRNSEFKEKYPLNTPAYGESYIKA